MNENAKKWIAALRSGEYGQTRHMLTDGNGNYCCLGVACEISGLGKWGHAEEWDEIAFLPADGSPPEPSYLSDRVRDWLKLTSYDGNFLGTSLAQANDAGKSFSEIADMIEANAEKLFKP